MSRLWSSGRSGTAKVIVAACAVLLVVASAVLGATGGGATAASAKPAVMRYACALRTTGLMRYVKRASACDRTERLVDLRRQPAQTCVLVVSHRSGATGRIPGRKGRVRLIKHPASCGAHHGREVPLLLPDTVDRYFCALPPRGLLQFRKGRGACHPGRLVVVRAPVTPTPTPNPPVQAVGDSATTDEDHAVDVPVTANDTTGDPPLHVTSVNADGAKGVVSSNPDGTLRYDPRGRFDTLAEGATASDSFTYRDADNGGRVSDPATVTVKLTGVNDAPALSGIETAALDHFAGDPAAPVSDQLAVADVDSPTLHGATVSISSGYDNGHDELSFTDAGGITGTWDAAAGRLTLAGAATQAQYQAALRSVGFRTPRGASGDRHVDFQVDDGAAHQNTSNTVSRTVHVDAAPVAVDDAKTLTEDDPATAIDVLANDTDADGGPKSVQSITQPAHGTATLASGAVSYTPAANACGADSFTYTLNGGSTGTVALTVTCVNDAPVNSVPGAQTTAEDTPITFSGASAPSVSDVDAGGDAIKVTLSAPHGTVAPATVTGTLSAVNAALDGAQYTPDANYNGPDTITLATDDLGHNGSGGAKTDSDDIAVSVTAVNDAPVNSVPGAQTTGEDTALTLSGPSAPSVSDADAGSDDVKVTLSASHGTLAPATVTGPLSAVNAALDGAKYTPDANYNGPDTITLATDDLGHTGAGGAKTDSDTVAVTVTAVDDAPAAAEDSYTTDEDTPLAAAAPGVLGNDTDVESDPLTAVLVSGPAHASSFTLNSDGSFSYTPSADYNGPDSFTYKANDGSADSNTATVDLTVNAVNDAPVNSVPGAQTTNEDTALVFSGAAAPSVSDVDAGGAGVQATLSALHGTVTPATVTGSVSAVNTALDGATYTPDANYHGADTITLTTSDLGHTGAGGVKTDTDTIAVTVNSVNDAPVATGENYSTDEDVPLAVGAPGVLGNDTDADADPLTAVLVTGPSSASSFTLNPDGSFSYTPSANANGPDSFTYKANDGAADSNTVTVALTVNAINDAPVLSVPGTQTINEDTALTLSGGNAPSVADADAGGSDVAVTVSALHGTVTPASVTGPLPTVNAALDGLQYTPDANFNGADTITVNVNDQGHAGAGGAKSDSKSITVNVTAVDDGPVNTMPGTATTAEDTPLVLNNVSLSDPDADPNDVSITLTAVHGTVTLGATSGLTSLAGNGTAQVTAAGTVSALNAAVSGLTFTPAADYAGAASLELQTDDQGHTGTGGPLTDDDTTAITVTAVNDAPVITTPTSQSTAEDTPLVLSPSPSITDVDADPNDVEATLAVSHGTLSLSTTLGLTFENATSNDSAAMTVRGTVTAIDSALTGLRYTPDANYNGADTLSLGVSDLGHNGAGGTKTDSRSTAITVGNVDDAPVLDLDPNAAGADSQATFAEVAAHNNSVAVAPNAAVSDVDDANLEHATITLTNHPDGNAETIAVDTSGTSITADTSVPFTITLTGSDTTANYQKVLRTLTYGDSQPVPDATTRAITVVVNDGDLDSNTATAHVTVVPLNVPPSLDLDSTNPASSDSTASFTEDGGPQAVAPNTTVTDADDTNMESATVTLTTRPDGAQESLSTSTAGTSGITVDPYDPATGVLLLHGTGTKADYATVLGRVAYDNASQAPTTTDRSITFKVNDGLADSPTRTATVTVAQHNDAPVNSVPGAQTTLEDTALAFSAGNSNAITVSDPDAGAGSVSVMLQAAHGTLTLGSTAGLTTFGNGTGTVTLDGTISAVNAGLDGTAYTPGPDYAGADSIAVTVNDNGNTGGPAASDTDPIAVTVTPVNDAPVITKPGAQTVDEDNPLTFSGAAKISVSDVDAGAGNEQVTLGVSHGILTLASTSGLTVTGNGTSGVQATGSLANVNTALDGLSYLPDANYNGPDSLSIAAHDFDGTANGGHDSSSTAVAITVNPVDDAPVAFNDSFSVNEDSPLNVPAAGVLANDSDVDSATLTAVLVAGPSHAASFALNADGSFTYTPSANYNGPDAFTYKANDGTSDSNTVTVSLTVNAVNDPPANVVPGAQTVDEDTNLAFSLANSNQLTVSDPDAGANPVRTTLAVTNGKLTLSGTAGLSFTAGDGTADATMTFTGTTSAINTALAGLVYRGNQDYNGSDTLTVTTNDQGNSGSGGALQDIDSVGITVNPVDDAPVAGDETFDNAKSAVGNTTLNVDDPSDGRMATPDPTDTSPVTDRPHKTISGDILANDTDVDSPAANLSVTPGTFATNDGGTVTIQSDGDFNFEPAPSTSCTDHSDFFDYTVSDNDNSPGGPQSDTGRVTVAIAGCVWYVNNNDAQGNSGTSEKPFDTLAQAQTASSAGDAIFVYDGDDSTTGYNAGVTLKANQQLLSEAADLVVGADTLHTADAANKASLTNNNADVVTLAAGSTVKGFNIDPQGTGGGVSGTSLGAGAITLDDLTIADNGTKGTQPGLELATVAGPTTVSNLTVNNGDGSSATTGDEGVRLNNAGTVNFATSGKISITTDGAAGLDAAAGAGTTSLGSASTFDDITVTNSGNGGVSLAGTTGSGTAFGDGTGNDLQLTTVSGGAAAFGVATAGSFSVPAAGQSDISATGGPAVSVAGSSDPDMTFDGVSSTNSATQGINLSGLGTGSFSAASGALGGFAGTGFVVSGGDGLITYPGPINDGSGDSVRVTGRSGGNVSLPGGINDGADDGGGISLSGNSDGVIFFNGSNPRTLNTGTKDAISGTFPDGSGARLIFGGSGVTITTTSGNGIDLTGVGPAPDGLVQITPSGSISAGTNAVPLAPGHRALNIADVSISSSTVNFSNITSKGGVNGVRLSDTGSNTLGSLPIFSVGGGTISNASGAGIDLSNMPGGGAAFNTVTVTGSGDDGIRADTVNNLTLKNSTVTNNGTAGANGENGLDWTNVKGVSGITNTTVSGSADFNGLIKNDTGSLDLTVTGDTFSGAGIDDGLQLDGDGTAVVKSNVANNTFANNRGDAFQAGPADGSGDTSQQDITFTGNTITGSAGSTIDGGVVVASADNEKVKANVSNNSISGVSVSALIVNPGPNGVATSTFDATVGGNTIGTSGNVNSGSDIADGLQVKSASDGDSRIAVTNNQIHGFGDNGLYLRASESNQAGHSTQLTATGNAITDPDASTAETAITAEVGSSSADVTTACMDIGGAGALANTFTGALNFAGAGIGNFWLSLRFPNSHLQAPGYAPTGTLAGRQAYFLGRNTGFGGGTAPYVEDGSQDMQSHAGGCTQPTAPTLPTPVS